MTTEVVKHELEEVPVVEAEEIKPAEPEKYLWLRHYVKLGDRTLNFDPLTLARYPPAPSHNKYAQPVRPELMFLGDLFSWLVTGSLSYFLLSLVLSVALTTSFYSTYFQFSFFTFFMYYIPFALIFGFVVESILFDIRRLLAPVLLLHAFIVKEYSS